MCRSNPTGVAPKNPNLPGGAFSGLATKTPTLQGQFPANPTQGYTPPNYSQGFVPQGVNPMQGWTSPFSVTGQSGNVAQGFQQPANQNGNTVNTGSQLANAATTPAATTTSAPSAMGAGPTNTGNQNAAATAATVNNAQTQYGVGGATNAPQVRTGIVTGGADIYRDALASELKKSGGLKTKYLNGVW